MASSTNTSEAEIEPFYWADGRRIPLHRDERVFGVRFRPGRRSDDALLASSRRLLREESNNVTVIPNHGLHVFTADSRRVRAADSQQQRTERLRRIRDLADEADIEYVSPAYRRRPDDPEVMFSTAQLIVRFSSWVTREEIDQLNDRFGTRVVERLGYLNNGFLLQAPEVDGERGAIQLAARYYEHDLVVSATPNLIRRRHLRSSGVATRPRTTGTEPRTVRAVHRAEQWHLDIVEMADAWNITRGEASISVAILDDGVDTGHPEMAGRVTAQFDFENHVADGSPRLSHDNHGTACAGVAVAAGVKAYGAAPGCSLMAVRLPAYLGIADEGRMFEWTADEGADVISCSWGPPDGYGTDDPLPDPTRDAIHYCVTSGRHGRGIPIFWAAGNGDESVSLDGYASNPEVIAVAASTSDERRAWYSDYGPEIAICAPSSGERARSQKDIFTTDRRGSNGYNPGIADFGDPSGNYTNDFGGTSSSTPLAAGIAGLMLSVAPSLTAQQVRQILQHTADKIGDTADYDASGHHHHFGHGRINAARAVAEAARRASSDGPNRPSDGDSGSGEAADTIGAGPPQGPRITTAARRNRDDEPPLFEIDRGGRAYYSVEVATRAELFDAPTHGVLRTKANFYPSWDHETAPMQTSAPYRLPQHVWERLESTERLSFRIHVADDPTNWSNYGVSTPDPDYGSAPAIRIGIGEGPGTPEPPPATEPTDPGEPGTGRTVRFASGTVFDEVLDPDDGIDYRDPVAGGVVPLISTHGRLDTELSRNFKLRELASRRVDRTGMTRHTRVSPDLVEQLQQVRDHLGVPIHITSGYRYPALNADVGGAERSQHLAGRAVDITTRTHTPLELAEAVLAMMGFDIGIGLGRNIVHVDLRGTLTTWVYDGAELDGDQFRSWVQSRRRDRSMTPTALRREVLDAAVPQISSAERWPRADDPPSFTVWPGGPHAYVVQVATDPRLFDPTDATVDADDENFHSSEEAGLHHPGEALLTTYTLPEAAWKRLRTADQLYYRLIVLPGDGGARGPVLASTYDEDAAEAPSIELVAAETARDAITLMRPLAADRRRDERLWRRS